MKNSNRQSEQVKQQITAIEEQARKQCKELTAKYNQSKSKRVKRVIGNLNGLIKKQSKRDKSIIRMIESEENIDKYLAQQGKQLKKETKLLSSLKRITLQRDLYKYYKKRKQFEEAIEAIDYAKRKAITPLKLKERILSAPEQYVKNELQIMLATLMSGAQLKTFLEKTVVVNDAMSLLAEGITSEVVKGLESAQSTNDSSFEGLIDYNFQHKYTDPSTAQIDLTKIFGAGFNVNQLLSLSFQSDADIDAQIKKAFGEQAYENLKEAFGINFYQAIARLYMQQVLLNVMQNIKINEEPAYEVLGEMGKVKEVDEDVAQLDAGLSLESMLNQMEKDLSSTVVPVLSSMPLPSFAPSFLLRGYLDSVKINGTELEQMIGQLDKDFDLFSQKSSSNTFKCAYPQVAKQHKGVNDLVKLFEHMQQKNEINPQRMAAHRERKVGRLAAA